MAPRIEGAEAELLQLDPDASKPEAIGDGCVDLDRFARDAAPLDERQRIEGAHVVQPVRELDEHDPQIAGHRHQHLAEVLGLRLGPALEREMGELADPVDEVGDRVAEPGRDMGLGGRGVLDDVMEQGGDDGLVIEAHLGEDPCDLDGMVYVGLAGGPALLAVGVGPEQEGTMDLLDLRRLQVGAGKAAEIADTRHLRPFNTQAPASPAGRGAGQARRGVW